MLALFAFDAKTGDKKWQIKRNSKRTTYSTPVIWKDAKGKEQVIFTNWTHGMTGIEPVEFEGREVVPIQFLKALLPDPSTLGENYTGKTSIGCLIEGRKSGEPRKVFIYNICDHEASWDEVRAQAVSYTTGVPTMVGSKMMLTNQWRGRGVFNIEQFEPDPFLDELAIRGLP